MKKLSSGIHHNVLLYPDILSRDLFLENCADGHEYDLDSASCVILPRGYYRKKDAVPEPQDVGILCPTEFITLREGSFSIDDCWVGK